MNTIFARLFADPLASGIAGSLIVLQLVLFGRWSKSTRRQLEYQVKKFGDIGRRIAGIELTEVLSDTSMPPEVLRAARATYEDHSDIEIVDPESAFTSERLLPRHYNLRLDSAASGMFTAIGILGTFTGLIISFFKIDFTNAASSIEPLIVGMQTAFINSLVGVGLSILWTYRSRMSRHEFDKAVSDLLLAFEDRFGRPAHGTHILKSLTGIREGILGLGVELGTLRVNMGAHFGALSADVQQATLEQIQGSESLAGKMDEVSKAVAASSNSLLENLAPRLEASFKSLVDMPFERLTVSVEQFREVLQDITGAHAETLRALHESSNTLSIANESLAASVVEAKHVVAQFISTNAGLEDQLSAAAGMVQDTRDTAESLRTISNTLSSTGDIHKELTVALGAATTGLRETSEGLNQVSETFSGSAARLESAVAQMQSIGPETARESVIALRREMEDAISSMGQSLAQFGEKSAKAYELSTAKVVAAVDERTSDLTDRLSAELGTLSQRLPEAAAEINQSVGIMRKQLNAAMATLLQSVRTLDTTTTETLAGRLRVYDDLIAKAVDHFSGTLLNWDGRVQELSAAAREISTALSSLHVEAASTKSSNESARKATTHA